CGRGTFFRSGAGIPRNHVRLRPVSRHDAKPGASTSSRKAAVDGGHLKTSMELRGFEPRTFSMPLRRAPNFATAPYPAFLPAGRHVLLYTNCLWYTPTAGIGATAW